MDGQELPFGQHLARTRWGTHASGMAFDRKKTSFLTERAQAFIVERSFCVLAGLGPQNEVSGLLAIGKPGFVYAPDMYTCLLQLDRWADNSPIFQGLHRYSDPRQAARLGLFFICHATRERLCVHAEAQLLPYTPPVLYRLLGYRRHMRLLRLHVRQVFFHCPRYIKTRIPGLTVPAGSLADEIPQLRQLVGRSQNYLSEPMRAFIAQQLLCFLCTVDCYGQCAVNHRGGAPGFLVTLPPNTYSPGGTILLPDFAGNGAFEALGNILETGQAAIVVPDYAAQLALCISGLARVLELRELPAKLAQSCAGAERIVALSVQRVEIQSGDWSTDLAHERAYPETTSLPQEPVTVCRV